jgi:hypothetical protein
LLRGQAAGRWLNSGNVRHLISSEWCRWCRRYRGRHRRPCVRP